MRRQWSHYLLAASFVLGTALSGFAHEPILRTIDLPGASSTQPWGINPQGDIVGHCVAAGVTQGSLLTAEQFRTVGYPGPGATLPSDINIRGEIVGAYTASGVTYDFLLKRDKFTTVEYPGLGGDIDEKMAWELAAAWLGLASISLATSAPEQEATYGFATRDYSIQMRITFLDPYLGRRLAFSGDFDPKQELWYPTGYGRAEPSIERFVGAVAVVRYSVKLANGGRPEAVAIRERVTITAQSWGLPERAPFSMTQKFINGIGSDIQAFGYDEGPLKQADRVRTRRQAQAAWWRLCRQELYWIGKRSLSP